jgi:hypothetical protein
MKEGIETPQQMRRSEAGVKEGRGREIHSPLWLAAFKAQATNDMMDDVYGYIATRATWVQHQQGRRTPGLIMEMVEDALGDTFAGVVTWEPSRCSLALHLKSVIKSRLSHEFERAEQYDHVGLADASEVEVDEVLALRGTTNDAKLDEYVDTFERCLREIASDDEDAIAILDSYLAGLTERAPICRSTGLTKAAYHNAHRRLKRLAENLPATLRAAAFAALT